MTIPIVGFNHHPVSFKAGRFGVWTLSPSSGGNYSGGPNKKNQSLFQDTSNNTNKVY
jgi:hypothetical protein